MPGDGIKLRRVARRLRTCPTGVLPLRFRWQTQRQTGELGIEPLEKSLALLPDHLLYWALRSLESARIPAHHRLPQGLGAWRLK